MFTYTKCWEQHAYPDGMENRYDGWCWESVVNWLELELKFRTSWIICAADYYITGLYGTLQRILRNN